MDLETHIDSVIAMTQASKIEKYIIGGIPVICHMKQEILPNFQGCLFLKRQIIHSSRDEARVLSLYEEFRPFLGLYRTFSELDIIEIKRLKHLIDSKQKIDCVCLSTLCTVIRGHSIFSLLS